MQTQHQIARWWERIYLDESLTIERAKIMFSNVPHILKITFTLYKNREEIDTKYDFFLLCKIYPPIKSLNFFQSYK